MNSPVFQRTLSVRYHARQAAVLDAGQWCDGERRGGVGKIFAGKQTHECVTVDDNWKECLYGSNFEPYGSHNRLLDKETIERVIEDSKGNLKIADSPFEKGRKYPSLEWATAKKINSLPIKSWCFSFLIYFISLSLLLCFEVATTISSIFFA